MDPAFLTALSTEALKSWGAFGIVLMLLGAIAWSQRKTIEALRTEIKELQAGRLEDAKQLIRVTENSTQTAAARAQGDTFFLETIRKSMEAVVDRLESVDDRMQSVESQIPKILMLPPPAQAPAPRQPRHRGNR